MKIPSTRAAISLSNLRQSKESNDSNDSGLLPGGSLCLSEQFYTRPITKAAQSFFLPHTPSSGMQF